MSTHAHLRVIRARELLVRDQPFFGCLALYMGAPLARPDLTETAATDGKAFFYNPAWVETQTESVLVALWAHEVMHCALFHHARMAGRDARGWNEAADYAVNPLLKSAGFQLWEGAFLDKAYDGLGAEEIYALRQQAQRQQAQQKPGAGQNGQDGQNGQPGAPDTGKPQAGQSGQTGAPAPSSASPAPGNGQPGNQPGNGQPGNQPGSAGAGQPGELIASPNGMTEADATESADAWNIRVREAVAVAKRANAGVLPAFAQRIIETVTAPRVSVRDALDRFIDSRIATEFTWSRPNRRYIGAGFHLPSTMPGALDHLVFCVDTSGSMDSHMLATSSEAVKEAAESGKVARLTVIFADAAVCAVQEFQNGDTIELQACGGGGTDFADTFNRIERDYSDATAIIYLTDMETRSFGRDLGIPTLWAVHGDSRRFAELASRAPFGESIYVGRLE